MDYYDHISEGYDELYRDEQIKKLNIIKSKIKIRNNSKLLDVGCGSGMSSDFGCFVVGIDPSMGLLKNNPNKNKIIGIAEMLPFRDGSFDWVISVTAMHNFDDAEKALKEIKRVIKKSGKIVITILKTSAKKEAITRLIRKHFNITKLIEEDKDIIIMGTNF